MSFEEFLEAFYRRHPSWKDQGVNHGTNAPRNQVPVRQEMKPKPLGEQMLKQRVDWQLKAAGEVDERELPEDFQ